MKRFVLVLVTVVALSGCSLFRSPDAAFVEGVDGYASVILPEYEAYLQRDLKDGKLSPETVKLRLETAQRFRALIEEAKKRAR